MKTKLLAVLFALSFFATAFAQNKYALLLKGGVVVPRPNIAASNIDSFNTRTARLHNKLLVVLQFEQLPSEEDKKQLAASGIQLLNYIPNNAYTATITGNANMSLLQKVKARAMVSLSPQQKMHPALSSGFIPPSAQKIAGMADVRISFPKAFSSTEVIAALKGLNVDVLSTEEAPYGILSLRIAASRLTQLASLPFIEYVEPAPPPIQPLNYNSRRGSRANVLNASAANGGKGLNGEGVVIGIGDIGEVNHADLSGR